MRVARAIVAALGMALLVLVLVWPFASGRWRGPLGDPIAAGDVDGAIDQPIVSSTTTLPPPSITVAAAGRYGTEILQGLEFAFFDLTGEAVDVVGLTSEFDVWKLASDTNRIGADVIEVGFRTDALSGESADAFLSLDASLVPSLSRIPPEFRLPDDRGVVIGFSGLLGLVYNENTVEMSPQSWRDLEGFDPLRVVVPAPRSVLAPVVVLALGDDIEAGIETYARWIEAGVNTAVSVEDFVGALRQGSDVALWTSSGLWRASGRIDGAVFSAPSEGAVALPAFSGVLSSTEHPEVAMAWLEFRLSDSVQAQMASIADQGRFGQDDLAALSPVVSGLDTLAPSATSYFRLDTFPGSVISVDWTAYADARSALEARFPEETG